MRLTYHPEKRAWTLTERDLDFEDAREVFSGLTLTLKDERFAYNEDRFQTIGRLRDLVVMIVWTPRDPARHIISMRRCNAKEVRGYYEHVDRSR